MNLLDVPRNFVFVSTLKVTVVAFVRYSFVFCFHVHPHVSSLLGPIVTVVTKISLSPVIAAHVFAKGSVVNAFESTLPTQIFNPFVLRLLVQCQIFVLGSFEVALVTVVPGALVVVQLVHAQKPPL